MQPFFNRLPDGGSVAVLGIGDGIGGASLRLDTTPQ